ncbi:MAG: type IX secretion system membrane protein PorP/SprF [Flavobacteriales bacterium]|nr:type IX secretion system membrane protein PorP/SprF [Flavobacteriales bacterium]MCX7767695.1 type IX secretion system membrane protein PorP/SprF [Flavobacteriales bacterium]MDW8409411.1 type IX secretion system membrane protein PorP/SprF [Flavobacteriales bacterium]
MRKLFTFLIFSAVFSPLFAQQDPQFTQFFFNKPMLNPASVGIHGNICATLFNRLQWTGFKGAPRTTQLTADASLKPFINSDVGVGLTVFNESIGFFTNTGLRVAGAYRIPIGELGRLSLGIDLGFLNQAVNPDWIYADPNDPNIPPKASSIAFDAGLGAMFQAANWYAGLSVTHIPGMKLRDLNQRMARHLWLIGGYTFRGIGGNPNWDISPNLAVKTDMKVASFDVNCNVIFKQRFWGGLNYRFQDAVALNLGATFLQKPKWSLGAGYSYDLTTSRIIRFSSGTHELMVRYCFVIDAQPKMGGGFRVRDLDMLRD